MKAKRSQGSGQKAQKKAAVRASITFPPALYSTLEEIAKEKKVSLAWVVRDASERYVSERSADVHWPGKG
jgi:metal-responsive CopG/Arc/MetJ family transcriptional regulator